MELNASINKSLDKEFEQGVTKVLLTPPSQHTNPGFDKNISDAQVDSYFEENKLSAQIDLDIVENSLLPTRHFFERFTDSVRIWMNETSTPQEDVREAVDLEIKDALRTEGINLLDKTVTIPMAREHLTKKIMAERQMNEFVRRSMQMTSDKALRSHYYDQVNTEVNQYDQN